MHSWFYFPNITIKTAIITNFAVKFSKFIKTFLPKKQTKPSSNGLNFQ
ncbi:hypothetical protein E9M_08206 [Moraxella catarrhalis 46P47B1]|uniref:Uncharacterized protein n=1 Tax=Moraxella catarrhalis TaxID=480 RepID=A0ABY0BKT9_MORCA|nr:hypothetical protein MCR_1399 [Moraxella catarrhalis BBH18]AZQ89652.1 hypothetical protein EJK50_1523 [Moraxella catarrhalis]EGE10444.1 hypothetical protein E9M_08206 [Moraxella catarrhalis 46P47B1]EGE12952.1 hypothetical protein E9K_06806 [Moraxella catarrhalis 103P14B1]EGE17816.1 hypothetical protein E9Q_04909 [Moraxella catarrhalis BC1]EGE18724.1 hypothetical protein E9S_07840 [Moraxella catarrhalis BC7]EGE22636.1 hypothetical protein E9W_09462 [Moraxella catarrhalis CO72]EGE24192.1 hy